MDGVSPDVTADVVVETEHALWALMLGEDDLQRGESGSASADSAAQLIDAMSWYAGTRDCVFGVISCQPMHKDASVAVVERYFRSKDSLRLRSEWRGHFLSNLRGVGSLRWTDLVAILRDCEQGDTLTCMERALARNVVTWLERVEIGSATLRNISDLSG
jgi:hypothetical protein